VGFGKPAKPELIKGNNRLYQASTLDTQESNRSFQAWTLGRASFVDATYDLNLRVGGSTFFSEIT